MQSDLILIRYSEIGLKGKQTRKNFLRILVRNIKKILDKNGIKNIIKSERGRIFLETNEIKKSLDLISRIFGIKSYSPVSQTSSDIRSISEIVLKLAKSELKKNQSFALRVTRTGTHDFTSMDVAVKIGATVVKELGNKVDLTNPDFEIFIDIRDKSSYIFKEKIQGPGGLPLGSQGKVVTIIKTQDSLLAAWYLMKRGCQNDFLISNKKLIDLTKKFCENWSNNALIKIVDSKKNIRENINDIVLENHCSAIITDHCLYKNEKSLEEISFFKKFFPVPVLNPLIMMKPDKINKKLQEIGVI